MMRLIEQPRQLERQPDVGVANVEMYRMHGVMLSTGNIWQLLILRAYFPEMLFRTPHEDSAIENFQQYWNEWSYAIRFNDNDNDNDAEAFQSQFRQVLQTERLDFDDADSGDDLPTKIAKAIAHIYYTKLELTVTDVQTVIQNHYGQIWKGQALALEHIDNDFIKQINSTKIDNNRMEFRALLPYETMIQIAVNELKHPPLTLQSVLAWMKAIWDQFVELLTDCLGCGF